jgi:hypothetical protein
MERLSDQSEILPTGLGGASSLIPNIAQAANGSSARVVAGLEVGLITIQLVYKALKIAVNFIEPISVLANLIRFEPVFRLREIATRFICSFVMSSINGLLLN